MNQSLDRPPIHWPSDCEMTDPAAAPGEAELTPPRGRFPGWRVVLVGALVLAIASDPVGAVRLPRIAEIALGDLWTVRGGIALFAIAHAVLTGLLPALLLPFVGWWVDRWGSRRMVSYGLITLGAGFVLCLGAQVTAVFYLVIAMFSIGAVVGSQLPIATAVNNWFRRRRAWAMAVMWLPWRVPIALIAAVGSLSLANREVGLLLMAAIVFVIAWPVSRLVRNRPEDYGQHPDGIDPASVPKKEPTQSTGGEPLAAEYAWREALKTRAFWMLALGGCGHAITAFGTTNASSLFVDRGFPPTQAAGALLLSSAVTVPFLLVGGWLGDRWPIRRVMFAFALVQSAALFLLPLSWSLPMFYLSSALSGIGIGGGTPLRFAAVGVYFGRRNFGTITGVSLLVAYIGSVLGGLLWGLVLHFGGYTPAMLALALATAAAALAFLLVGDPRPSPLQLQTAEKEGLVA